MMNDYYKEGKLEDLLEKYNIYSLKELESALKKAKAFDILEGAYRTGVFQLNNTLYKNTYLITDDEYWNIYYITKKEFDLLIEVLFDE